MKRIIEYLYFRACECCCDGMNEYIIYEDGIEVEYVELTTPIENEEQLRKELVHLEPFEVSEDSVYF